MELLKVFDDKDYSESLPRHIRETVRAVIIKDNKIALIKSGAEGF